MDNKTIRFPRLAQRRADNSGSGIVVRFDGMNRGQVIIKNKATLKVGHYGYNWIDITDESTWKILDHE
jgi:hypothetical protein